MTRVFVALNTAVSQIKSNHIYYILAAMGLD